MHGDNSEMRGRIRDHDWAATPLGPRAHWPRSLKTAVDLMLDSAQATYIAWGAELISLYNDGYIAIAGGKHPGSLGQPYRRMWAEIWDEYRPMIDQVMAGHSQHFVDHPVALAER